MQYTTLGSAGLTVDAAVRTVNPALDEEEVQRLEAPYRPHEIMGH